MAYAALALATIVVGLAVHLHGASLGGVTRDVLGDALWAMMITWWMGALAPDVALLRRGMLAYAICGAVELSQLYHTPALDAVRATLIGHLMIGSGFDPRDLLAYALGVGGAGLLEIAARVRRRATV